MAGFCEAAGWAAAMSNRPAAQAALENQAINSGVRGSAPVGEAHIVKFGFSQKASLRPI